MGTAREWVVGSGAWPACTASVPKCGVPVVFAITYLLCRLPLRQMGDRSQLARFRHPAAFSD
jgi:hypothetical protein